MINPVLKFGCSVSLIALAAGPAGAQSVGTPAGAKGPAAQSPADAGTNSPTQVDAGGSAIRSAPTTATGQPGDNVEEIIVTGFRASIASAINAKRTESGMVDVIKAEDIAEFPDNNLAESIQRVPGVSIARDAGEGRTITVRGLGPSFTRVRINGMEAQSTTGATDSSGGANRGRGFDFNVFASELFNSITVRKTQQAEVSEGSLGATVDLQTSHPFDFKGTNAALSAQGSYNDLRQKVDPRLAGLFSTTFADGTFGVLVSAAYSKSRKYEDGVGTVGFDTTATNGGYCAPVGFAPVNPPLSGSAGTTAANCSTGVPRPANTPENIAAYNAVNAGNGAAVHNPRLPRYGRLTHDQERLGLTGSLQWAPSERTLVTFDALYSDFKADREENFIEAFSFSRALSNNGKPQTGVRSAVVSPTGDLVYGVFDNVDIRSETRVAKLDTKFDQYTLSARQDLTDWWTINGLIGTSTSDFSSPQDTTVTIDRANSQGYSFDYRDDNRRPSFNYNFDVTNPANYSFVTNSSEIRLNQIYVKNTFRTGQINSVMKITEGFALKLGGDYKRFGFDSNQLGRTASTLIVPALPAGKTIADLTTTLTGFGKGLGVPAGTPTSWLVPDVGKYAQTFDIFSNTGTFLQQGVENSTARGNIRGVVEQTKGYYGQVDFNGDRLGIPIRGDLGVRYITTKQRARGYQLLGATPVLVTSSRKYDEWLPAINLTLEVKQNLLLRFGAAKVLSRPELGNLTPGGSITVTGARSVTQGNPLLDPIKANTVDLAAEWYFARDSLLSVAYFYKKIGTYIQTLQEDVRFDTLGLSNDLLANSQTVPSDIFTSRRPVNTPGGPLRGFELNLQTPLPFHFLPDTLDHFGLLANYTHVTSKIDYFLSATSTATTAADLVGLSKNAANATLYFDNGRFSVRGSLAYRDKFLTAVPGQNTGNDVNGTSKITTIDANMSYALNKSVKLTIEGLNLTDAFVDQYQDSARNSPFINTHTGRQINFGAQVKF